MSQNDYDELLKKGYTEEQIDVTLDNLSGIGVSDGPLAPNRDDRSVVVSDSEGNKKKTSSIMMGYNAEGITLENGEYVSFDEFDRAVRETLVSDGDNEIYVCKKTGKIVSPAEMVDQIYRVAMERQSGLLLSEDNSIINQTSARVSIKDPRLNRTINKGIFMLGNQGFQLPNGEYVFLPELQGALDDYVKMVPGENLTPVIDKSVEEEEIENLFPQQPEAVIHESKGKEIHTVIKRIKQKFSVIPLVVAMVAVLLAGFDMKDQITTTQIESISQTINYEAVGVSVEEVFETQDEIFRRVASGIEIGQPVEVQSGVDYYASSDYSYGGNDASGSFGYGIREAGEYNVDYISVLHNGRIIKVEMQEGENLADVLDEMSTTFEVSIAELEPMVHLGGPVSGWVRANDLYETAELVPRVVDNRVVCDESESYSGVVDDFQGDTITIEGDGESVSLKIVEDNGEFVQEGSIVVGSDGQQYRISKLESNEEVHKDTIEEKTGSKLTWSIHNISKEFALLAGAASVAGTLLSARKKKEMVDMTQEEIDKLVSDAEQRFNDQCEYTRSIHIMTVNEPNFELMGQQLIDHEITVETIESIGTGGVAK